MMYIRRNRRIFKPKLEFRGGANTIGRISKACRAGIQTPEDELQYERKLDSSRGGI